MKSILAIIFTAVVASSAVAGDLSVVPLFDGERADTLNLWGGPLSASSGVSMVPQSTFVHMGSRAYQVNLGTTPSPGSKFIQALSSGFGPSASYRQDRDLTQYQALQGFVRNNTGAPVTLTLELKDYRDGVGGHIATRNFSIPSGGTWTQFNAPLDLSSGWNVIGSPDMQRAFAISFLVPGNTTGSIYFDDVNLIENGPSIDPATAPIETVVERIAKRQFMALWAARNKISGIIPNSSNVADRGALNTTTGVVWNLPSAIRRGWVSQAEADAYMTQLVASLNTNRDQTTYLPSRFLDLVTAAPFPESNPAVSKEESSIDAAFIALALHSYKSQPATSATLRSLIDVLESRFDFSAFAGTGAYKHAYFPVPGNFGTFCGGNPCTYNGYTNENKVIALAADLAVDVPLDSHWNKDTGRALAHLVDPNQNHLVYSFGTEYRAPFVQALLNLFVDTSERGADNYPNRTLARNPWMNFVRYEAEVAAKLDQLGRENFFQPDAGAGAGTYQAWSLYNNFGQPNLFQPWSVALALMAGAPGSEDALRFLLDNGLGNGLDGPQGLADSAQWATGAANPTAVPSWADNWNMTLSTMALMEFLEGSDRLSLFFANLPDVKAALDTVFIAGDYAGGGTVNTIDYNYWRQVFDSRTLLAADGNNDGIIDAADYVIWRKAFGSPGGGAAAGVPEPGSMVLVSGLVLIWITLRDKRTNRKDRQ